VVLSLDDYYLPYQELQQLYQSTASSLYEFRGNPGTHDTALLAQHLKVLKARGQIDAPVYDKLARNGIGDRRGTRIVDPADIVIFEGWMLGFTAKQNVNLHLQALNEMLKSYEDIWKLIDNWIFLKVEDLESIYEWRWEQELENCRRRGVQCRSRAEIDDFVSRFIPTYLTYYIPRPDAIVMKLDTKRTISRS
jgi:D-glycerate 3-kinase